MRETWFDNPLLYPLWGALVLLLVPVIVALPGELTGLVALIFTTPHRALVYGAVGEVIAFLLFILGVVGWMVVDE